MVGFHDDLRDLRGRVGKLRWLAVVMLLAFALVLFRMQILQASYWRAQAENNRLRRVEVLAQRGLLRDRQGRVLVGNRAAYSAVLLPDRGSSREAALTASAQLLGLDPEPTEAARGKLRDPFQTSLVLAEDIGLEMVSAIEARRLEMPELQVRDGLVRYYRFGAAAAHALGYVGEIRERQLNSGRYPGYRQGDIIGLSGLEARYESWLRGRDGSRLVVVDSHGRVVQDLAWDEVAEPGHDLDLALDIEVQRAGERSFGSFRGAAVLMDVRTGAVRAFISRPPFDPNAFASGVTARTWKAYTTDEALPLYNRALKGRTAPGSVFKVVSTITALERGLVNPNEQVNCPGWAVLHRETFRCWREGGHGLVDLEHALEKSCNVYYYKLGDALGINVLAEAARQLGLGDRTGIDLDGEVRGLVPDPAWKREQFGEQWWPGETVSVSIGQGALSVSVLEVASMLSQVANDGVAMTPYLVEAIRNQEQVVWEHRPQLLRRMEMRPNTKRRVHDALCAVVNRKGTARRARIEGYQVCGKTGTSQVRGRETAGPAPKDHAWFAGFAPGWDPRFAVAVLVEHGGHGGESAAPIARELLKQALEAERIPPRPEKVAAARKVAP